MIKEILNDNFDEIAASKVAVVDFNATWCGPCRMLAPILEELSEEYAGQADFFGVDVDENAFLAQKFGVMSIPMLVLLKDGEPVAQNIGFVPKPMLENWLKQNL